MELSTRLVPSPPFHGDVVWGISLRPPPPVPVPIPTLDWYSTADRREAAACPSCSAAPFFPAARPPSSAACPFCPNRTEDADGSATEVLAPPGTGVGWVRRRPMAAAAAAAVVVVVVVDARCPLPYLAAAVDALGNHAAASAVWVCAGASVAVLLPGAREWT